LWGQMGRIWEKGVCPRKPTEGKGTREDRGKSKKKKIWKQGTGDPMLKEGTRRWGWEGNVPDKSHRPPRDEGRVKPTPT